MVLLILIGGTTFCFGQPIRFDKIFGTVDADAAFTVHNTDSGYVTIGFSEYIDSLYYLGPRVVFHDYDGNIQADKHFVFNYAGIYRPWNDQTKKLSDGYISCVGYADTIADGNDDDIIFIKYDLYGDTVWTRIYNFNNFDTAFGVEQTSDKGFVGAGYSFINFSPNIACARLVKIDSLGNLVWSQTYNCDYYSTLATATVLQDGSIVAGGIIQEDNQFSYFNSIVIRTDSLGNLKWSKKIGGPYDEYSINTAKSSDSNILVAGSYCLAQFEPPPLGYCDKQKLYLAKLDSTDGHIIWDKMYGDSTIASLDMCAELPNGDIIAVGSYGKRLTPNTPPINMGCILKTSSLGDSLWMRTYYYTTPDTIIPVNNYLHSVKQTPDGGYIACGQVFGSGLEQDSWIIKTDEYGCLISGCNLIGIDELEEDDFRLFIYPNPAQDFVTVELPINHSKASLQIINMQGQIVKTVRLSGNGSQTIDTTGLPGGIYQLMVYSDNKILGKENLFIAH